jgi:hypothetical protein
VNMIVRQGVIRGGQVIVDVPIELPDGSEVTIAGIPKDQSLGNESSDEMTPEEIVATLAAMDRLIPFEMTPEEEAAWAAERLERKDWEKAHFAEHAEKLRRMWQ